MNERVCRRSAFPLRKLYLLIYQLADKRMQENSPQGNFDYLSI